MAMKTDVTSYEETRQMADAVQAKFSAIDILVNNAGGDIRGEKNFNETDEEDWDCVVDLNLKGVRNCTRAVINHMIQRKTGNIINISSTDGMIGYAGAVSYSAAKAGVIGFTMALAKEVAQYGINVNCISPGPIVTEQVLTFSEEMRRGAQLATGMGREGKPEEVAALVAFIASEDAAFMSGQNFPIAGLMNLGLQSYNQR
jgi:acetoacetyl-CoA reductase